MNLNEASGPDLISHKMIKNVSVAISKPLCFLFNRFLKECDFPDDWKNSNVLPLQKKGMQIYQQIIDIYHYLVVLVK